MEAILLDKIDKISVQYQDITPRIFTVNSKVNNHLIVFIYDKKFIPLRYLTPARKWVIKNKNLMSLNE